MLPTKVQVNWPFSSGGDTKKDLSWQPSWISDQNILSFFFIYKSPQYFLPSFKSTGLSVHEKKQKIHFFKMAAMAAILDFQSELF